MRASLTHSLTYGHDGLGGHVDRDVLAGVGHLAQPLQVLAERPLLTEKDIKENISKNYS